MRATSKAPALARHDRARPRGRRRGTLLAALLAGLLPLSALAAPDDDDWDADDSLAGLAVQIHGFVESATASRVLDDPTTEDQFVLGEARFRLEAAHDSDLASLSFKGDLVADAVAQEIDIDIREAAITLHLARWLDIRAGRQVLTWGTGDLFFLNDLFPKDFVSFFIGRADEYLKAPSNSVKLSLYSIAFDLDLVWTPIFTPDRFINGERLSFYDRSTGEIVGGERQIVDQRPSKRLDHSEAAARLHRNLWALELALYGYFGYSKRPLAIDEDTGEPTYSRLAVYGMSLRGPLFGGVFNLEGALHHSFDDADGDDPNIPNSQGRGLAGYEHELFDKFTAGLQYYAELILSHDQLLASSPAAEDEPDELRHVFALRLTYLLLQENLTLSLFAFIEPLADEVDLHVRPFVQYKLTDAVALTVGGNIMFGSQRGFFGQLEKNTNVYGRARYSF